MLDEYVIPFPGVVIDLTDALALQELRARIREIRPAVSLVLSSFAARSKLDSVPQVRTTETGIIVYAEEFQVIRYGGLCGMVSQLTLQTAGEIRHMCQKAGITFEYGGPVAPEEVEILRECKARPTGFRPPPEPVPIIEELRRLA